MSRHTQQATTTQQKISNFLFREETVGAMPHGFIEFCHDSMEALRGAQLCTQPILAQDFASTQFDGADGPVLNINESNEDRVIMLESVPTERTVAAIDTSTVKLGELEDGMLCALRGAIVTLEAGNYHYHRYGPFVFSLGYNSPVVSKILENLGLPPFSGEPNIDGLLKRVRNVLERWLQFSVSSSLKEAFVLIDGSLTAGTPDNPSRELERILEAARHAGSVMIAISKKTKLRIRNESLTNLLAHESNPCLVDVDSEITEQFPPFPVRFLGRVFVAKLAKSGYPFRIDIDREMPSRTAVREFSQLAGTDIVDQGYPETLRLAHILSTFTATDVLAMQAFAKAQFDLEMTPKLALRHSLFGPFGTRWEALH
jgi:NurA domain